MAINITDRALEAFHGSREDVAITLRDGGRLSGRVVDFDGYTIILSGNPDILLYRHSILKMMPSARAAQAQRPAVQMPRDARPRKPHAGRQGKPSRHEPQAPPKPDPGETSFANPMADEMMKWLKSQKGGG